MSKKVEIKLEKQDWDVLHGILLGLKLNGTADSFPGVFDRILEASRDAERDYAWDNRPTVCERFGLIDDR